MYAEKAEIGADKAQLFGRDDISKKKKKKSSNIVVPTQKWSLLRREAHSNKEDTMVHYFPRQTSPFMSGRVLIGLDPDDNGALRCRRVILLFVKNGGICIFPPEVRDCCDVILFGVQK